MFVTSAKKKSLGLDIWLRDGFIPVLISRVGLRHQIINWRLESTVMLLKRFKLLRTGTAIPRSVVAQRVAVTGDRGRMVIPGGIQLARLVTAELRAPVKNQVVIDHFLTALFDRQGRGLGRDHFNVAVR